MMRSSLSSRLRWLMTLVLIAVLLPLGVLSFQRTIEEMDELSDGRLAQAARTLDVLIEQVGIEPLRGASGRPTAAPDGAQAFRTVQVGGHAFESEVGFQVFDRAGEMTLATTNLAALPPPGPGDAGFRDVRLGGYVWRIYTLRDPANGIAIRAGERYDSRNEIMGALWLDHGLPLLVGLPLLALLVGWAVKRGLRPLESLARGLATREPGSREPVVLHEAPRELQPVLDALNDQLRRIEDTLERERRFSADVAHELRTPLAAIVINLDNALASDRRDESDAALASAQVVVGALARRIEQLLALARLESGAAVDQRTRIDLDAVAAEVIEELAPLIAESGASLSVDRASSPVLVDGYEAALAALLRNLVENALRHVPAGGQVMVCIGGTGDHASIEVIDDGPGIAPEHRDRVFSRFHRAPGSRGDGYGLGLSIVQRAAQLHGASLELLDAPFPTGLRVRVTLPRAG